MRKLIVNQKLLSIREQFTIDDEYGNPVYRAEGSLFAIPKRFTIADLAGNELATVRRELISLFPRFNLEIGGQQAAVTQIHVSADIIRRSFRTVAAVHRYGRDDAVML